MSSTIRSILALSLLTLTSAQVDIDLETCTNAESNFNIKVINMGNPVDNRYALAFEKAAGRWEKLIVGDLPDVAGNRGRDWFGGTFSRPYTQNVDDVVVGYSVETIDGEGGTLGRAGGVFTRRDRRTRQRTSTISGIMQFDKADFDAMPIDDVKSIILHEMGHVLGLVGSNGACNSACNPENPRQQGVYECPLATAEYERLAPNKDLLLENRGGLGTACGHWEEDIFQTTESSELMTGFFEANKFQPLSLVTAAALDDIGGYTIDYCGADIWPANEQTSKRYEIFRTSRNMTVFDRMDDMDDSTGLDEETRALLGFTLVAVAIAMVVLFAILHMFIVMCSCNKSKA